MQNQHIAMIGSTAPSHIYPSLAIIRELVARGHRVSYAVGEPLTGLVAPTGAEVVSHPSILPLGDQSAWPEDPASQMRVFLDEGIQAMPVLTDFYDENRPDLVLYDIGGLPGPVLARRYGVPAVQLSPTYVAWEGYEEDMGEIVTAIRTSPSGKDYFATFTRWLNENGIEADAWDWISHPEQVLALLPKAMQPNVERVPSSVRFVGPALDPERLADRSWTPPSSGRKVLLMSLGTAFTDQLDLFRACVDGFRDSDWHVVISIGQTDPAALGPLPEHIEVRSFVPQLAVLEAASAFITHAGMGGSTESLWYGVPTVAIPLATDGFGNAAKLAELGVGEQLPADEVTASTLRAAVERVAGSPSVAARLAEVRAETRGNGGIERAADAVESFLP
ncbi:Oleandomycin glycosyltransferase [Amycolatopsis japonica]|uniref:Oleandomycin glycosyltransferase n=1 Tax=Amycolatopsis japonica TaxID=208439 RepID=A0A075V3J0_9PSEU|nr:macrolide family glycosyltransferase [Amycolatopsis japonica]AIG79116.1 Oleandomycin glycosyltransferase [Amycolatopsis japonica]